MSASLLNFRITVVAVLIMAALIPVSSSLAVHQSVHPLAPHFLYMFGHGNILHWAINSWALLVVHNTFRWHRLLTAYLLAVALSFAVPAAVVPAVSPAGLGVLGASVITTFFFGLITPYLWRTNRFAAIAMVILLLVSCILPGFAAVYHVIPFIVGFIYRHIECIVRSYVRFIRF